MYSFSRQIHLRQPTNITNEIVTAAFQLFKDNYKWEHPIRSLGIRAADLVLDDIPVQLDLFGNQEKKEKLEKLDRTVDEPDGVYLISLNQKYRPIQVLESDSFKIFGKVIGKCKGAEIPGFH